MPAGDSMPDTYIAIMLQSLKKKEQVLDEIIRLDDQQKDTLTDPECPFDVFDETVEAKSACIDQLNQLDSGFEKLYAQVAEELDQNREDYAKEIRDMQQVHHFVNTHACLYFRTIYLPKPENINERKKPPGFFIFCPDGTAHAFVILHVVLHIIRQSYNKVIISHMIFFIK